MYEVPTSRQLARFRVADKPEPEVSGKARPAPGSCLRVIRDLGPRASLGPHLRDGLYSCKEPFQNTTFACTHMLRMPLSVKSRLRKRPAEVPFTLIWGTFTNWG